MLRLLLLAILSFAPFISIAQSDSSRTFDLDLEYRPRFEFRNGYQSLPADTLKPAYFISQRSRLNFNFSQNKVAFCFSVQDVRVYGQNGISNTNPTLSVFESYARFDLGSNWNLKLGRQGVELDNGRLFSRANWNQYSRSHDGFRLNYTATKWTNDLLLFYNQSGASSFGNDYNLNLYKYLVVQYAEISPKKIFKLKLLNTVDGYQSPSNGSVIYARATSGGRIEYNGKKIQATVSSYYQYGRDITGRKIEAYYIQPEIGFSHKNFDAQLGMEYLSGNNGNNPSAVNQSFSTLYGVAFKFMGHLDYFTSFPRDVNGAGLINPYLFLEYKLSKKWRFKLESHIFMLQNTLLDINGDALNPFLGVESDIVIKYTPSKEMYFDFGFSSMSASPTMGEIKMGNYQKTPVYSYLMFTWKPTLFHLEQPL